MPIVRRRFLQALAGLAGLPARAYGAAPPAPASAPDTIVTGKTIHAVAGGEPVQAFALRGGRFTHAGGRGDILSLRGRHTRLIDVGDATIVPGLIDAHQHLSGVGFALHEIDLYHVASFEEVVRRAVAFAHASTDPWVLGDGWDQNLWPGKAFPSHAALSAALPQRPVVLHRVDGHAVLANARAMELAGITNATREPAGGRILRQPDGAPSGVFIDNAQDLITSKIPPPTHAQFVAAARSGIAECNRYGITAVAEPGAGQERIDAYEELLRAGRFSLRNYVMLADDERLLERYFALGPQSAMHDGRLWIRAVKMYADGALGSRGAALLAPYSDDLANSGLTVSTQAHIADVTRRALGAGFQSCVHAIGDRANRMVLDAFETALASVPAGDHRLRIEHAQVLAPGDIPRFAALGVIPSMQTTHQSSDMPWAELRLGPERVRGAYAWRSLMERGCAIANGTDAPVEAVDSRRTFHAAISRQDERNAPPGGWYPEQRMTRAEALASMTSWAAHANFQDDLLGSIAPGKYADFVVMDRDWMRVPVEDILETRVLATYSSGEAVYEASTGQNAVLRPRRARNGCCGAA